MATHGHGLLLLRSGKTNEHSTRIDVLIRDVRAMEIRSWSDGLEMAQTTRDYLDGFQSNPIEMCQPGNKIYSLKGNGWQGFVVGGILSAWEDDLDFDAPSALTSDTSFGSGPF